MCCLACEGPRANKCLYEGPIRWPLIASEGLCGPMLAYEGRVTADEGLRAPMIADEGLGGKGRKHEGSANPVREMVHV